MLIGGVISKKGCNTAVANHEIGYSACAIAWIGGKKRFLGASAAVGVHAPFNKRGERIAALEAVLIPYLRRFGFHDDTAAHVLEAGPKELRFVTNEQDGKALGIELTRMSIPEYIPLP